MPESKRAIGSDLAKLDATTDEDIARQIAEDPDAAPELTDADFDNAEVWQGNRFLGHGRDFENGKRKGGRPKGSGKKEMVTLRIDRDVLDQFRAGGPGWQTRLNDALRAGAPEAVRRGDFDTGYAAAMQAVQAEASRSLSAAEVAWGLTGHVPIAQVTGRKVGRGGRRRSRNARMIEEVLQSMAPRALRPAEIREALQDNGVAMAITSIHQALSQIGVKRAEPGGDDRSRRQRTRA
jgi:uncharacterized protein (DUF4415 family)